MIIRAENSLGSARRSVRVIVLHPPRFIVIVIVIIIDGDDDSSVEYDDVG